MGKIPKQSHHSLRRGCSLSKRRSAMRPFSFNHALKLNREIATKRSDGVSQRRGCFVNWNQQKHIQKGRNKHQPGRQLFEWESGFIVFTYFSLDLDRWIDFNLVRESEKLQRKVLHKEKFYNFSHNTKKASKSNTQIPNYPPSSRVTHAFGVWNYISTMASREFWRFLSAISNKNWLTENNGNPNWFMTGYL